MGVGGWVVGEGIWAVGVGGSVGVATLRGCGGTDGVGGVATDVSSQPTAESKLLAATPTVTSAGRRMNSLRVITCSLFSEASFENDAGVALLEVSSSMIKASFRGNDWVAAHGIITHPPYAAPTTARHLKMRATPTKPPFGGYGPARVGGLCRSSTRIHQPCDVGGHWLHKVK